MYVEYDHKTQHPLFDPTRLKRLRVFCCKATISYCFAIEALSPEQGGIRRFRINHSADVFFWGADGLSSIRGDTLPMFVNLSQNMMRIQVAKAWQLKT